MSDIITPPDFEDVDKAEVAPFKVETFDYEGYELYRIPYGIAVPDSGARSLRVMHIRDFALRSMMPDSLHRFSTVSYGEQFTTGELFKRDAYMLLANEDIILNTNLAENENTLETNLAGFGWLRPIINPNDCDRFEDYDLEQILVELGKNPSEWVTAAIEIFDGYRNVLTASELIRPVLRDYHEFRPDVKGVCVRAGSGAAIKMLEKEPAEFKRITTEDRGAGGIFICEF